MIYSRMAQAMHINPNTIEKIKELQKLQETSSLTPLQTVQLRTLLLKHIEENKKWVAYMGNLQKRLSKDIADHNAYIACLVALTEEM